MIKQKQESCVPDVRGFIHKGKLYWFFIVLMIERKTTTVYMNQFAEKLSNNDPLLRYPRLNKKHLTELDYSWINHKIDNARKKTKINLSRF